MTKPKSHRIKQSIMSLDDIVELVNLLGKLASYLERDRKQGLHIDFDFYSWNIIEIAKEARRIFRRAHLDHVARNTHKAINLEKL